MSETYTNQEDIRRVYQAALASFVEKVQQDRYVVAAILYGSLAYDDVWEKSDIDIVLVGRDDKPYREYAIVEHGIVFHVNYEPRRSFKAVIERELQGTITHSIMTKSTLLFSTDDRITEYYQNVQRHVGEQDRSYQLLNATAQVLPVLTKAEKWLYVKKDVLYSYLWLMRSIEALARIEVLLHGDVASREVIQQALAYNPDFFTAVYSNLAQQPKDEEVIAQAIQRITTYIEEKIDILFAPILDYLVEEGGVRSTTEIYEHLHKKVQAAGADLLGIACEWLARKNIIQQVTMPVRLTEKSHITLDEAAYYYDGEDSHATNNSH